MRLSIGAVTVLNRWQQVLTAAISDSCIVGLPDGEMTGEPEPVTLGGLLAKKSLTMEEAVKIKEMMKSEKER